MLYKVVLTFETVDHILSVTILMKATEQYFVYGVYCAVVVSFQCIDEVLKCDHSNESY